MRPVILDLYSGAGGAAMGYYEAGFDVVGVDIKLQKNYPFEFVQADALEYLETADLSRFDAIHASPPCQGYSSHVSSNSSPWAGTLGKDEPALIAPTRAALNLAGLPSVIENVMGARTDLWASLLLCGSMFDLPIPRHRLFETSWFVWSPPHCDCRGLAKAYAEQRGWDARDMSVTGKGRRAGTLDRWAEIMGWPNNVPVTQHGLREAIPPAYTRFIGAQLMQHIKQEVRL